MCGDGPSGNYRRFTIQRIAVGNAADAICSE